MLQEPPRARGLPLIGSGLAFVRAPVEHVQQAFEQNGPVFTISLGPKTMAILIGPTYAAEFFRQPSEVLSVSLAAEAFKPIMGDIAYPDGKEEHRRLIDALVPLVAKKRLDHNVSVMLEEASQAIAGLGDTGRLELVGFTERLSESIAVRCFLGDAFARRVDERFRQAFSDLIKSIDMVLPPYLPIPKFRRRDRARAYIGGLICDAVMERRTMADPPEDSMQGLSTLRNADGEYWSMKDTVDLMISVLFGGHHTTGALMAWTIVHLLQNPPVLARVMQELEGVSALASDELQELSYLAAAVRESERLSPPSGFIIRVAQHDLELGGYRIRKGWMVALCPPVAQRLPDVFERPDEYEPERFLGGVSHPPHALIGFGGGAHACVGKPIALLSARAFVATLLRSYELELVGPPPVAEPKEVLRRPVMPCMVEFRRRSASASSATVA